MAYKANDRDILVSCGEKKKNSREHRREMFPCRQQPAFHTALMSRKKNLTVAGLLFVELEKKKNRLHRRKKGSNT